MSNFATAALNQLNYILSLPERTLRSLAAVAGGTTLLLTENLFPPALRGTTIYGIVIGDMQRFVVERIAQMEREGKVRVEGQLSDNFAQRKIVGTAIETAGLLSIHLSPVWVFAIAADAAAGSTVFLERLVEQLRANHVISAEANADNLVDLLSALQESSRRSAAIVDTPPLSREQLAVQADALRRSYGAIFASTGNLLPRFDAIWGQIQETARREKTSPVQIEGLMTLEAAKMGQRSIGAMLAVGQTGGELVGEAILASYAATLSGIAQEGLANYFINHMRPFWEAAVDHFRVEKKSWTESILSGDWRAK